MINFLSNESNVNWMSIVESSKAKPILLVSACDDTKLIQAAKGYHRTKSGCNKETSDHRRHRPYTWRSLFKSKEECASGVQSNRKPMQCVSAGDLFVSDFRTDLLKRQMLSLGSFDKSTRSACQKAGFGSFGRVLCISEPQFVYNAHSRFNECGVEVWFSTTQVEAVRKLWRVQLSSCGTSGYSYDIMLSSDVRWRCGPAVHM